MFGASPFTLLKHKLKKKQQQSKNNQKQVLLYEDKKYQKCQLKPKQEQQLEMGLFENDSDSESNKSDNSSICQDLNVFVVTFQKMKEAQKNLSGGDPYQCKSCKAILNSYSHVIQAKNIQELKYYKLQLKQNQSLWVCQFCSELNILNIEKQEIPTKSDIVYMLQSKHQNKISEKDDTMIFCIDVSGSMNTTSEIAGKVDLKYGLSQEQIQMVKQFMEPGDQAQFNFLPGNQNINKTFISRKQCILSAIENHLNQLKKSDPLKKVGFVTFNNQVTVLGDKKTDTVNIVGDKLYSKQNITNSLKNFKLSEPICQSFENLINNLNKTQAKGQTALGPAIISAVQIASKGNPGSSIYLCTDGLSNIGIGALDPLSEQSKQFYVDLALVAKQRNLSVNIMTIKGQGCKMEIIGKLAQTTHGNMKVVNPQKLADDFANVLKDEVVGLNVTVKIILHKSMQFRKQIQQNLKEEGRILIKSLPNATVNSKISFQYQLRNDQELQKLNVDLQKLKKIPFQAQIEYTSSKGGQYLRIITSETKTTTQKQQLKQDANLGVVHQRVTSVTAALYSQGQKNQSVKFNNKWSNFLNQNFKGKKQYEQKQKKFEQKNTRLKKAIKHKVEKQEIKQVKQEGGQDYQQQMCRSLIDSDEDQMQLMDNLMQKQNYSFSANDYDEQEQIKKK